MRAEGRAGVSQWSAETAKRFRRRKKETEERRGRPSGSVALTKEEDDRPPLDQPTSETIKQQVSSP